MVRIIKPSPQKLDLLTNSNQPLISHLCTLLLDNAPSLIRENSLSNLFCGWIYSLFWSPQLRQMTLRLEYLQSLNLSFIADFPARFYRTRSAWTWLDTQIQWDKTGQENQIWKSEVFILCNQNVGSLRSGALIGNIYLVSATNDHIWGPICNKSLAKELDYPRIFLSQSSTK